MSEIATGIPAPRRRQWQRRVSGEVWEALERNDPNISVLVDRYSALAIASRAFAKKWLVTRRREGEKYRVWRVG